MYWLTSELCAEVRAAKKFAEKGIKNVKCDEERMGVYRLRGCDVAK
jgi:hypothetical protein